MFLNSLQIVSEMFSLHFPGSCMIIKEKDVEI